MKKYYFLRRWPREPHIVSLIALLSITLAPHSAYAAFGAGAPTVPNSNFLTGQVEDPKIEGSTGALTQRISLDIPPGRNALQPDVSLQYNSQNTSDGIVGYGWSLSTPYIQRLNKTGSQELYSGASYFTSSIDGELALNGTAQIPATTTPTILDALPLTLHSATGVMSDSWSYTVPSGGQNKLLVVLLAMGSDVSSSVTATQNGVALTCNTISGNITRGFHTVCFLANPTSGTLSVSWSGFACGYQGSMFTLRDAAQTSPVDAQYVSSLASVGSSLTTSTTTATGYDLLIDHSIDTGGASTNTYGAGQSEMYMGSVSNPLGKDSMSYKTAAAIAGSESMTRNYSPNTTADLALIAVKAWQSSWLSASTYSARVDDGSHTLYLFSTTTNSWVGYDKKGTKYTYGSDDSSRMYDTRAGTSTNTYRWLLKEVRDTNDNYITYTYNRDNNVLYP